MDRRRTAAAALIGLSFSGCAWNQARLANVPNSTGVAPVSLSGQPGRVRPNPTMPLAAAVPAPDVRSASRPSLPPMPDRSLPAEPPAQMAAEPAPRAPAPPAVVAVASPQTQTPAPAPAPEPEAKLDPALEQTALETTDGPQLSEDPGEPATVVVARVGDTVITTTEFAYGVRDRIRGASYAQLTGPQKAQVQKEALEYLIDRAMLVQEARKRLKNPKQWDTFKNAIEKEWLDKELPSMIARERAKHPKVDNEFELEKFLAEQHQSLQEIRENYMLDHIGRYFMMTMIQDKFLPPNLNDIYAYYDQNRDRAEFQQTAQVSWRLIFIPRDESTDRNAAKLAADSAYGRLSRGEDFAAVCKQVSQGPRAEEGGLWSTGYESYASDTVNQALRTLPLNQVSPILEDDRGFYIVRVEDRREAGAKPFSEVQKSIREALLEERYRIAMEKFLHDVRQSVPVSCPVFEGTPLEPKQLHPDRVVPDDMGIPPM